MPHDGMPMDAVEPTLSSASGPEALTTDEAAATVQVQSSSGSLTGATRMAGGKGGCPACALKLDVAVDDGSP